MGGDGGVVATNRRYMRGAGTADHTGDHHSTGGTGDAADAKTNRRREAMDIFQRCALTQRQFQPTDSIVVCRYGRFYLKEAAIQVLLLKRRKTTTSTKDGTTGDAGAGAGDNVTAVGDSSDHQELTWHQQQTLQHVNKLSELYDVRGNVHLETTSNSKDNRRSSESFPTSSSSTTTTATATLQWTCPITLKPLNGTVPPAIVLVPGNPETHNVVSAFALQQLSTNDMEMEYGPIRMKIKVAPTPEELVTIQETLAQERLDKKKSSKQKAKKKKLEGGTDSTKSSKRKRGTNDSSSSSTDPKATSI